MVKAAVLIFSIASLVYAAASKAAVGKAPLKLTPQAITDLVIKNSYEMRQIRAQLEIDRWDEDEQLKDWSWELMLALGSAKTSEESLGGLNNDMDSSYTTQLSLSKKLVTGTQLKLNYDLTDQKSELTPFSTSFREEFQTYNKVMLELRQELWQNSFGYADRRRLTSASQKSLGQRIQTFEKVEELVLNALKQYWKTFVSGQLFRESLEARDRYAQLTNEATRKRRLGFAGPGEFAQASAELEEWEKRVKEASIEYLQDKAELARLLNLESSSSLENSTSESAAALDTSAGADFELEAPQELPLVPSLAKVKIEDLRVVRSLERLASSQESKLDEIESDSQPSLAVVGRVGATGLEKDSAESMSELKSGEKKSYFVGVELGIQFGSGFTSRNIAHHRQLQLKSKIELESAKKAIQIQILNSERQAKAMYGVAVSARKQVGFRRQAVKDLLVTYRQGRTSLDDYVRALNELSRSETAATEATGNFHIVLNEWAAFRDELVKSPSELLGVN